MITNLIPETWKALQDEVGGILKDCGFAVEVEKKIDSARGAVEVDVFAEEVINGRKYVILIECKHWRTNIPQNVIHGFRTILSDTGANKGYIITTSNFQSGSKLAIENTNVELLTWASFQEIFFKNWYENYFINELYRSKDLGNEDSGFVPWFDDLSREDRKIFFSLRNRLSEISTIESYFMPPLFQGVDYELPQLPIKGRIFCEEESWGESISIPDKILAETGFKEFLKIFKEYQDQMLTEFLKFRAKFTDFPLGTDVCY